MNNINKTLYIPLYGKAYASLYSPLIWDSKAIHIWDSVKFPLKGKSKSKWLAYYMAMRALVYDEWVFCEYQENPKTVVLHVGCGLDSRCERVSVEDADWYDIDFPEVIEERKIYFEESDRYHMISADVRTDDWKKKIPGNQDAIIVMEGISMYLSPDELVKLLSDFSEHFHSVKILMDCYSEKAAFASKYKNPIKEVGVTKVFGYDDPQQLASDSGLEFCKEWDMTPERFINRLNGTEKFIFRKLYAGKTAKSLYRMYEFKK